MSEIGRRVSKFETEAIYQTCYQTNQKCNSFDTSKRKTDFLYCFLLTCTVPAKQKTRY